MAAANQNWDLLGHVPLAGLADARLQAHYAAQWLARAARAFVPPKADDSHTSLTWNDTYKALAGANVTDDLVFALDIAGLGLLALQPAAGNIETFRLDGRTDKDAGAWMADQVSAAGFDASRLAEALSWDMPDHPLADGGTYQHNAACLELSQWFANAAGLLEKVRNNHKAIQPGPSPVRCWPHHFDIATLISLGEGDPEQSKSVGVGLSPGDETYGEPYFYISPWPYPENDTLPHLPPGGHWHTQGFTAAVATASELLPLAGRTEAVHRFVSGSVTELIQMLQNKGSL